MSETGMVVHVEWVPSASNKADKLTCVPSLFTKCLKAKSDKPDVTAASVSKPIVSALLLSEIADAQKRDDDIVRTVNNIVSGSDSVADIYKSVRHQLVVEDGVLCRSVKFPPNDTSVVPVVPQPLQRRVVCRAHAVSGHGNWEVAWKLVRSACYFANMAAMCQSIVQSCSACAAANPTRGPSAQPSRAVVPSGPWNVIQVDNLELGPSKNHQYHCVLVCTDMFTKWVEVVPLRRHDGASVAAALVDVCSKWGAPEVVRCDNGSELVNHMTTALYEAFGVRVLRGAVRHPQSQGAAERFNRTLLTLIRKTVAESDDWVVCVEFDVIQVSESTACCDWYFANAGYVWLVTSWPYCGSSARDPVSQCLG